MIYSSLVYLKLKKINWTDNQKLQCPPYTVLAICLIFLSKNFVGNCCCVFNYFPKNTGVKHFLTGSSFTCTVYASLAHQLSSKCRRRKQDRGRRQKSRKLAKKS